MRIFSWVQSRLSGRREKKRDAEGSSSSNFCASEAEIGREELGDWRQGLLAIGTLGSNALREEGEKHDPPLPSSKPSNEASDFTVEEVMKLQRELSQLLKAKPNPFRRGPTTGKEEAFDPAGNRSVVPASLKVGHGGSLGEMVDGAELGDLSPESVVILRKARDLLAQNRNLVRKKSVAFLLKNALVCRGGFEAAPCLSLRDPTVVSSMEKLLRIMLHKKIFPQSSSPMELKKYLENKPNEKLVDEDKSEEKEDQSCKWVKTDSDFIVLEI